MNRKLNRQMSESFITAAFLSLSGGFQDAYTYILRGKVFANAQTGNIVLLSQSICERNWSLSVHYLIPLIFFALGVAVAELIHQSYRNARRVHWRQLVVITEIILLFFVGFIPDTYNLIANAIVSFSCAMQVQSFRKVNGYAFSSTMCIGNIRSAMESLVAYKTTHNTDTIKKAGCYFGIIILFGTGAAIGGRLISILGMHTIWVSCVLLFINFSLMFIHDEIEPETH